MSAAAKAIFIVKSGLTCILSNLIQPSLLHSVKSLQSNVSNNTYEVKKLTIIKLVDKENKYSR